MPHPNYHPEYLEQHAQQLRDNGAEDVAIGLEQCARLWRDDQVAIERLLRETSDMQIRVNRLAADKPNVDEQNKVLKQIADGVDRLANRNTFPGPR